MPLHWQDDTSEEMPGSIYPLMATAEYRRITDPFTQHLRLSGVDAHRPRVLGEARRCGSTTANRFTTVNSGWTNGRTCCGFPELSPAAHTLRSTEQLCNLAQDWKPGALLAVTSEPCTTAKNGAVSVSPLQPECRPSACTSWNRVNQCSRCHSRPTSLQAWRSSARENVRHFHV